MPDPTPLARWVTEANAIASETQAQRVQAGLEATTMAKQQTVVVIEPLIFLGPNLKALPEPHVGDVIVVAGGRYAQSLIDSGYVRLPGDPTEVVVVAEAVEDVPEDEEPEGYTEEALLEMTNAELREIADGLGLSVTGNKAKLVSTILGAE